MKYTGIVINSFVECHRKSKSTLKTTPPVPIASSGTMVLLEI